MNGTYIYGIIRSKGDIALNTLGVDRISSAHVVENNGLGCVVSDYTGVEFESLSREQLVKSLFAHQQVVEHVMRDHSIIPVKFGTFLKDRAEAFRLLNQGHSKLLVALATIEGKVEVEVAATWDIGEALGKIGLEEDVVRARNAIIAEGQPTIERQVQMGQIVKACMDRRRDSYRDRMLGLLEPLSVDMTFNALVSDEMVMNVAFLVEQARQQEFDQGVRQLDDLLHGEISFRVIGPLPPYSFSTVEIARISSEEVDKALRTLHIDGPISETEVKRTYRRMAAEDQRNSRSQGGQIATLKTASELILHYCRAWNESNGYTQNDVSSLQTIDDVFDIKINRVRNEDIASTRFGQVAVA